jgi:transcriptional regulator with XRE-family HTH domain
MSDRHEKHVEKLMKSVERNRRLNKLSQRALSEAAGLSPTTYWAMLKKPKAVLACNLFALMEAAGVAKFDK